MCVVRKVWACGAYMAGVKDSLSPGLLTVVVVMVERGSEGEETSIRDQ